MRPVWLLLCTCVLLFIGGCGDVPFYLQSVQSDLGGSLLLNVHTEQVVAKTRLSGFTEPTEQLTLSEVIRQPQRVAFTPVSKSPKLAAPLGIKEH